MADLEDLSNLIANQGNNRHLQKLIMRSSKPLVGANGRDARRLANAALTPLHHFWRCLIHLQSQEDAELERKLRELKSKQDLRKDWFLFILRNVLVFSAALIFIFAVGGYSLFTLSTGSSSEDEKKFATSVLALIVTGLVSFVTGRATATPK